MNKIFLKIPEGTCVLHKDFSKPKQELAPFLPRVPQELTFPTSPQQKHLETAVGSLISAYPAASLDRAVDEVLDSQTTF